MLLWRKSHVVQLASLIQGIILYTVHSLASVAYRCFSFEVSFYARRNIPRNAGAGCLLFVSGDTQINRHNWFCAWFFLKKNWLHVRDISSIVKPAFTPPHQTLNFNAQVIADSFFSGAKPTICSCLQLAIRNPILNWNSNSSHKGEVLLSRFGCFSIKNKSHSQIWTTFSVTDRVKSLLV